MSLRANAYTLSTATYNSASLSKAAYLGEVNLAGKAAAVLNAIDVAKRALIDISNNLDSTDTANVALVSGMLTDIGS